MSAAPPNHLSLNTYWVVLRRPGRRECQIVYGRAKKEIRKKILAKIAGTNYKLTCVKPITLPEYSWYDYDTELHPSEDTKLEDQIPRAANQLDLKS